MANKADESQRMREGQAAFWAALEGELAKRLDGNVEEARARLRAFMERLPALFEHMQARDPQFSPELFFHTSPAAIAESLLGEEGEGYSNLEAPPSEEAQREWVERYKELTELDLF